MNGGIRRRSPGIGARPLAIEVLESRIVLSASCGIDDAPVAGGALVAAAGDLPEIIAAPILSVEDWVHSLTFQSFNQLTPDQAQYLTTAQIATIPDAYWFGQISPAVRNAFSNPQIQAINVAVVHLSLFTPSQINALSVSQIRSLELYDFKFLTPAQVPTLTPAQISTIPDPGPFSEWTAAARAALTPPQVQALRVEDVRLTMLTSQQIGWLTTSQIQSLKRYDFEYLSPSQISQLTPAQISTIPDPGLIANWTSAMRAALTQPQVQSLYVAGVRINWLTSQQINWLSTLQIRSVFRYDFEYLSAAQIPVLTPAQISTIPDPGLLGNWTTAQLGALTQPQVQALNVAGTGITMLTPTQTSYLTAAQIQSLRFENFKQLTAAQAVSLTPAQIATIPDQVSFGAWPAATRAALGAAQVQSLNVATVWINWLTPAQVGYLTTSQIQSLRLDDFKFLSATQIPALTPAQIALIPDPGPLSQWTSAMRAALTQPQVRALRVATVRITQLTSTQIGWLTRSQIQSLNYYDLNYLSPVQIPLVLPSQVASIPSQYSFSTWSVESRYALSASQLQALNVAVVKLNLLSQLQVTYLTPGQIQSLKQDDFRYLSAGQTPSLTPAQIAEIPDPSSFASWNSSARAVLSPPQIQALNVGSVWINLLSPEQVSWLTAAQVRALRLPDFQYLPPTLVPFLTAAQVASIPDPGPLADWTPASRAALTQTQIQALNVGSVRITMLTAQQISWLTASQIQSLQLNDFQYLSPAQIPFLTPAQIALMPDPGPLATWTTAMRAALTQPQVQALRVATVRIATLTATQVGWLTAAQVQSLTLNDFRYLNWWQIPLLTSAQIAQIPDPGPLADWTVTMRAVLTQSQVRALNVATVRITMLSPTQVGWLTAAQVQSLLSYDFVFLNPSQIPLLTPAQIASIPDPGLLAGWSPAMLAALTQPQIQSLRVATIGIGVLTTQQISWLTTVQVQSLNYTNFALLATNQIPLLTTAQMASIPTSDVLRAFSFESQAALSRNQLLALQGKIWGEYAKLTDPILPPTNYTPVVDMVRGADGLFTSSHLVDEYTKVFNLVPLSAVTHATIASGDWSNPAIWANGQVPSAGAKVLIAAGTTVRFDRMMTAPISTLRIDGKLSFATNLNTQLIADTIVVYTTGVLHIGTATAPIASNVTARIKITTDAPISTTWDPYNFSRGLISRGEVRMFGATTSPYIQVSVAPSKNDTVLRLTQVPANWKVGDRIVLTGTDQYTSDAHSEELVIRAIDGSNVTVDPLRWDHKPPAGFPLAVYVSNLERNVVFEATNPSAPIAQQPHMMFLHNPNVDVENIAVYGFGRTNKSLPLNSPVVVGGVLQPGTGTNPRARYAMHFHHTGVDPNGQQAIVKNNVIVDNPGWAYVNHSSNVLMENNVAYRVNGAAFSTEDGNEIGVMRGNLSITTTGSGQTAQSREATHDFGHSGNGFWLQGPGVAVIGNIAVGNADAAFIYYTASSKNQFDVVNMDDPSLGGGRKSVPVGAIPLETFDGNIALASKSGLEIWFHQTLMTGAQTYIDNFTSINTRTNGIELHYVGLTAIRNAKLIGDGVRNLGVGVLTNYMTHDISILNPQIEGYEIGILAPGRRNNLIDGGVFSAVHAIEVNSARDTLRTLFITGQQTYRTLSAAQLAGRTQYNIYLTAEDHDFIHRSVTALLSRDRIYVLSQVNPSYRLYFPEQVGNYVPFTAATSAGFVPPEYIGRTNQDLADDYEVALAGSILPSNVVQLPKIWAYTYLFG